MKIVRIYHNDKNARIEVTNEGARINKNKSFGGSFYYTFKYLKNNKEILKELYSNMKIENLSYKDEESFLLTYDLIKTDNIFFNFNYSLSTNALEALIKIKNLKKVFAYYVPKDYVDILKEKNVEVNINSSFDLEEDFLKYNEIESLDDIYYMQKVNFYSKESIVLTMEKIVKISRNLLEINMYYYSKECLEYISRVLKVNKIYGVKIFIYANEDNYTLINKDTPFIKLINSKTTNKVQVLYEEGILKNKVFKTMTFNVARLMTLIVVYSSIALMLSKTYHEYAAALELRILENKLNEALNKNKEETEVNDDILEEDTTEETKEEEIELYQNIPNAFPLLKEINSDVNSWITINNTKVNYPVVKTTDNDFYLNHDLYKNYAFSGWIFMDYRSSEDYTSKNTIIYGHSMKNGIMLGTLYKAYHPNWYLNKENQIITINTPDGYYKYKIFSIYKIEATSDYLDVDFVSDNSFLRFIDMIKDRSVYNFGTEVTKEDKIITISTCSDNNLRLVIHAVKI